MKFTELQDSEYSKRDCEVISYRFISQFNNSTNLERLELVTSLCVFFVVNDYSYDKINEIVENTFCGEFKTAFIKMIDVSMALYSAHN